MQRRQLASNHRLCDYQIKAYDISVSFLEHGNLIAILSVYSVQLNSCSDGVTVWDLLFLLAAQSMSDGSMMIIKKNIKELKNLIRSYEAWFASFKNGYKALELSAVSVVDEGAQKYILMKNHVGMWNCVAGFWHFYTGWSLFFNMSW